jgi:hypothetical protein
VDDSSQNSITAEDLKLIYGRSIKPKELATFLGLDARTLIKYADTWGGVEVSPGNWRFFENLIKEVIKDAEHNMQAWKKEVSRKRHDSKNNQAEIVSRCDEEILSKGHRVGKRNPEKDSGAIVEDKFGIFADRKLDK